MELSVSRALVIYSEDGRLIGANFLKKTGFECTNFVLKVLYFVSQGLPYKDIAENFTEITNDYFAECVSLLVEQGALIQKDTAYALEEEEKLGQWDWGLPSSLFHFSGQDDEFLTQQETEALQLRTLENIAQPPLFELNEFTNNVQVLNKPSEENELISLMARRRSVRDGDNRTIDVDTLSDCLYAGLGITDFVENCAGNLPLSMTPSGGARNPYEAYVYVSSVSGLEPGVYHYSAFEHNLSLVTKELEFRASELVANQEWADNMACLVFLCAYFERTMWKYKEDKAYRVVMIEAGHIGQNIMLAATRNNCTACPTAALAHAKISEQLKLKSPVHSPVYVLAIGNNLANQHA